MSSEEEKIQQILSANEYEDPEETLKDVLACIKKYPGLKPVLNHFVINNGIENPFPLLTLTGTLPVQHEGTMHNITVIIWLPTDYPKVGFHEGEPKLKVFLTPTPISNPEIVPQRKENEYNPNEKRLEYIEPDGKLLFCNLDQCLGGSGLDHPWIERYERWNLVRLIDCLVTAIVTWPPVGFVPSGSPELLEAFRVYSAMIRASPTPWQLTRNMSSIMQLLRKNDYQNPEFTANHVRGAFEKYKTLKPVMNRYVYNNGTHEELLTLSGTLRVQAKKFNFQNIPRLPQVTGGDTYDIRLLIWLPKTYPWKDPAVFIRAPDDKPNLYFERHVSPFGTVYFGNTNKWGQFERDGLALFEIIEILSEKLSTILQFEYQVSVHYDDIDEMVSDDDDERTSEADVNSIENVEQDGGDIGTPPEQIQFNPTDSNYARTENSCLVCSDPAVGFEGETPLSEDEAKQMMTLCKQMMPMNKDDIPKEFRSEMFPLCASCKDLAKDLWGYEVRMEKIKETVEKKAVEGVILDCGPQKLPLSQPNETNKPFTKLRDVIVDGYRKKLRMGRQTRSGVGGSSKPTFDGGSCSLNVSNNSATISKRKRNTAKGNEVQVPSGRKKMKNAS